MQSMMESTGRTSDSRDLFSLMGNIFANVKTSYEKLKKSAPSPQPDGIECVHGTKVFEERIDSQSERWLQSLPKIGCPAFSTRSNVPDIGIPSVTSLTNNDLVQAHSNSYMAPQSTNMNSLDDFQTETPWLEGMLEFNKDPEMNNWDFGMMW